MTPPRPAPDEAFAAGLAAAGRAAGLDVVGVARAEPFTGTLADLRNRKAAGLHAGMGFTYRRPERSADPTQALPDAASLVVGARSYHRELPDPPAGAGPLGRTARYVWEDHYGALEAGLRAIALALKAVGWRARVLADDNALVDREAAYRAGLGWYGKNANLLLPGRGSWFVLGAVLTDAPLPVDATPVPDGCGTCGRCLGACPTGAIVAPGVVDARRCLSWLLQQPGPFPREHRVALGDRMYGCDDCQEVCPPNRRTDRREHPEVAHGAVWVPLLDALEATDDDLLARYGRWYLPGRDPDQIRRNALVALANVGDGGDGRTEAALRRYLAHPRALLRAHAVWAAARLRRDDLLVLVAGETEPEVLAELAAVRAGVVGVAGRVAS